VKLSTKGKYGLYAMVFLAQHSGEGPMSLKAIAELGLPEQYLEQLLGSLRRAGLVTTVRGAQGGYHLSREPKDITVLDIIDAMEGPVNFSDCLSAPKDACPRGENCPTRGVWEYLTVKINDLLSSVSLEDMLNNSVHARELGLQAEGV
jgi:Rrf2 family protein